MTAPRRIQRKRTHGWRKPPEAVNVTRPSIWGNPFPVTADGRGLFPRDVAVRMYRELVVDRVTYFDDGSSRHTFQATTRPHQPLRVPSVDDIRRELAGRDLVCWCPLDRPCHADVLLDIANNPKGAPA